MIDLHSHSTASDGNYTPKEVAIMAKDAGLYAMALTDHDVVSGFEEFKQELEGSSVMPIAGSEIGIEYKNLAAPEIIAMDIKNLAPYIELQTKLIKISNDTNRQRIEMLQKAGVDISWEDIEYHVNGMKRELVVLPHLSNALIEKGLATGKKDVAEKFLGIGAPGYLPKPSPSMKECIDFVLENGDVPILSHPGLYGISYKEAYDMIVEAKGYGLMGIEVFHPRHSKEAQQEYYKMAKELCLIPSGGSDFHGSKGSEMVVGKGIVDEEGNGNVYMPDIILDPIFNRNVPAESFFDALEKEIRI